MIRLTITLDMPDYWGADDAFDDGGIDCLRELISEDVGAFWEDVKKRGTIVTQKMDNDE